MNFVMWGKIRLHDLGVITEGYGSGSSGTIMRSCSFGSHRPLSSGFGAWAPRLAFTVGVVFEDWAWIGCGPETDGAVVRGGGEHKPVRSIVPGYSRKIPAVFGRQCVEKGL